MPLCDSDILFIYFEQISFVYWYAVVSFAKQLDLTVISHYGTTETYLRIFSQGSLS